MSGNNVPFSLKKTKRRFLPNIQNKRVYIPELDQHVRLRMTTRAMRTMDKKGGLMNYLRDEGLTLKDVT
jgi:large subunit ribosomal protein L28